MMALMSYFTTLSQMENRIRMALQLIETQTGPLTAAYLAGQSTEYGNREWMAQTLITLLVLTGPLMAASCLQLPMISVKWVCTGTPVLKTVPSPCRARDTALMSQKSALTVQIPTCTVWAATTRPSCSGKSVQVAVPLSQRKVKWIKNYELISYFTKV